MATTIYFELVNKKCLVWLYGGVGEQWESYWCFCSIFKIYFFLFLLLIKWVLASKLHVLFGHSLSNWPKLRCGKCSNYAYFWQALLLRNFYLGLRTASLLHPFQYTCDFTNSCVMWNRTPPIHRWLLSLFAYWSILNLLVLE